MTTMQGSALPTTTKPRSGGPAPALGITCAVFAGFGFTAAEASRGPYYYGVSSAAVVPSQIAFVIGLVLIAAALLTSRASGAERLVGAILAAAGAVLIVVLGLVAGVTDWRPVDAVACFVGVGLLASGLIVGLGFPRMALLWVLLLVLPAFGTLLTPSFAGLLLCGFAAGVIGALVVLFGLLMARKDPARVAERQSAASQADVTRRAEEIRKWEEAYALSHNGERPPAGYGPTLTPAAVSDRTNTLAILALVASIIGSVIGLILGYVARSQIKRTGEQGAGLALAAIIIGWVSVGLGVAVVVIYVIFFAVAYSRY